MTKQLILLSGLFLPICSFAQLQPEMDTTSSNLIYIDSFAYPSNTVYVRFIVEENGEVNDIEVFNLNDPAVEASIIRSIKMVPREPVMQEGKPVRTRFIVPVMF